MSVPIFAQATKLMIGDGIGGYTQVARVGDLPFPDAQRDLVEVTDHSSPNGSEEFIAGLTRTGEIQFQIRYIPSEATHELLRQKQISGEITPFRIEMVDMPDGGTHGTRFDFDAIVRQFRPTAPVNGAYTADVVLKVTGSVVFTPAA